MQPPSLQPPVVNPSLRPMGFDQQLSVPGSAVYFQGCFRAFAKPADGQPLCAPVAAEVAAEVAKLPAVAPSPGDLTQLLILQGFRGAESASLLAFAWLCHTGVRPVIRHQVALADFELLFLQFVAQEAPEIWITTASWESVVDYFPEYHIEELALRNLRVSLVRAVWPDAPVLVLAAEQASLGSSLQQLELVMTPGRADPVLVPWIADYYGPDFEPQAVIAGGWPGFRPLAPYIDSHPLFWGFTVALECHWYYNLFEAAFADPAERTRVMLLMEGHLGWGGGPDKPGGWCDPRMKSRLTFALARVIDPVLDAWFGFLVKAGVPACADRRAVLGGFLRLFTSHSQPWL